MTKLQKDIVLRMIFASFFDADGKMYRKKQFQAEVSL